MTAAPVFAQRTILWLIAVGGLSFVCAVVLIVFGEDLLPTSTIQANAYSESAVGHMAFVETLRALGIPVLVSRSDSNLKAGPDDTILVAEPPVEMKDDEYLGGLLETENVLFVLPKWWAFPEFANRHWAGAVERVGTGSVEALLRRFVPDGRIVQVDAPIAWPPNRFGAPATIDAPQLMTSERLVPIIADKRGMLLGYLPVARSTGGVRQLWILSDPDILSNRGLIRGSNAALSAALVDERRLRLGTVIVDEVIHGFRRDPSVWRALFEFPIIIITINALAAAAVLLWSATGRFGSPIPMEPPLKAGKTTLIGNAAGLLQFGGHTAEILGRYLAVTFADVARRVHAPAQLAGAALDQWLERIGKARHVRSAPAQLRREAELATAAGRADDRRPLHVARDLHRWKREMLHGSGDDSLGRRTGEATAAQGGDRAGRRH